MNKTGIFLAVFAACLPYQCSKSINVEDYLQKADVRRVDLKDVISQTGEVQPIIKVELKSEASGKIDFVYVKEGERLKKGDRILKIDPTRLMTQREKLDLAARTAKLKYSLAKRDYENAGQLFAGGQLPKNKLEDLKNDCELKKIAVQESQLELNDVIYQLSKTLIVSPMDGVLISLLVEAGEIAVSATSGFSGGTAIGTVADISKLEVLTRVGEVDYARIKQGQKVEIGLESDASARTSGTVSFISLSAKKEIGSDISNFEVRISIDSLFPGLVPGVNVNVEFVVLDRPGVLGVPYDMVRKEKRDGRERFIVMRPEGTGVPEKFALKGTGRDAMPGEGAPARRSFGGGGAVGQRIDKKKAAVRAELEKIAVVPQRVELGATDYKFYEVLDGLAAGDIVVKVLIDRSR